VLLLCSVMLAVTVSSKNSIERLDDFRYRVCREGCITKYKQALPHSICAEISFILGSTGQDIYSFYRTA